MLTTIPAVPCQIHASCVSVQGRGVLIVGQSGSGKSALALQMMAYGAELVADDRCDLSATELGVIARKPDTLPAAIEARGVGILASPCCESTVLTAIVDLDSNTVERLPALRQISIGPHRLPVIPSGDKTHLVAALLHFLKHGFHGSMGA